MTVDDVAAFADFVAQVPEGERRFLKDDLAGRADADQAPGVVAREKWARRLLAVDGQGHVAGFAGAFPGGGWSSHVAELRVLVSEHFRRRGVGRALARAALVEALDMGCTHAYVEVISEQEALVGMFQDLGFEPEALLADFVRDAGGDLHDLMLLTHRAEEQWGRNQVLGLGEVVG